MQREVTFPGPRLADEIWWDLPSVGFDWRSARASLKRNLNAPCVGLGAEVRAWPFSVEESECQNCGQKLARHVAATWQPTDAAVRDACMRAGVRSGVWPQSAYSRWSWQVWGCGKFNVYKWGQGNKCISEVLVIWACKEVAHQQMNSYFTVCLHMWEGQIAGVIPNSRIFTVCTEANCA